MRSSALDVPAALVLEDLFRGLESLDPLGSLLFAARVENFITGRQRQVHVAMHVPLVEVVARIRAPPSAIFGASSEEEAVRGRIPCV